MDQHRLGHGAHQRDAPPPIGQTVDGGRLGRRYPVAVVDDLDAQRAGFGPQGQLDDPGAPRPVGVADGVRRRLVDGQHHACGLVVGQRERGEPARQLATDHRQLRRVGGPAAVYELDSAVLGHVSSSLCASSRLVVVAPSSSSHLVVVTSRYVLFRSVPGPAPPETPPTAPIPPLVRSPVVAVDPPIPARARPLPALVSVTTPVRSVIIPRLPTSRGGRERCPTPGSGGAPSRMVRIPFTRSPANWSASFRSAHAATRSPAAPGSPSASRSSAPSPPSSRRSSRSPARCSCPSTIPSRWQQPWSGACCTCCWPPAIWAGPGRTLP